MVQLIQLSDIVAQKGKISINIQATELVNQSVFDAQRFDIKRVLGDAFYYDFVNNYVLLNPDYLFLFNGGTYVNADGDTVYFYGLKAALIEFSYARIVQFLDMNLTRSGAKYKHTGESSEYDNNIRMQAINTAKSAGHKYFSDVLDYLDLNKTLFPIYRPNACRSSFYNINWVVNRGRKI